MLIVVDDVAGERVGTRAGHRQDAELVRLLDVVARAAQRRVRLLITAL